MIPSKPLPNLHPGGFVALGVIGRTLKRPRSRTPWGGMVSSRRILVIGFPMLALVGFRLLAQLGEVDIGDGFSLTYSSNGSASLSKSYAFCSGKLAGELDVTHNRDPKEAVVL